MKQFQHISALGACELLESTQNIRVVDIRDEASFGAAHIAGAYNLNNGNMADFIQQSDLACPVLVMCDHGISSQGAAEYLCGQGFEQVYSIDGGFEAWESDQLPLESA